MKQLMVQWFRTMARIRSVGNRALELLCPSVAATEDSGPPVMKADNGFLAAPKLGQHSLLNQRKAQRKVFIQTHPTPSSQTAGTLGSSF